MFSAAKNRARSQHLVHGQHILIPQPAASYQQVGFVYGNAAGVMSESCHYVIMFFCKQGWLAVLNDIDFDNICGILAFHLRINF